MIVMPVHDIQSPGRVVLLAERVVKVEVDFLSLTTFLPVLDARVWTNEGRPLDLPKRRFQR
jgi:hypothetical protein